MRRLLRQLWFRFLLLALPPVVLTVSGFALVRTIDARDAEKAAFLAELRVFVDAACTHDPGLGLWQWRGRAAGDRRLRH